MQGEFRMITDLATVAPKELLFNYDELKAFLTDALRDYKALVVTEDGIADARAKRAKLNKLADNINAYRINVKKQLMEQYEADFKPKCDELVNMTKEASDNISAQVKAFEQREADAKIAEIKAVYDAHEDAEAKEYCPWNSILNPKWANKGYGLDDAKEEVVAAVFRARTDLDSIRQMGGDDTPYLLDCYKQMRDINIVIRKAFEIRAAREREEERRRIAEERQAAAQTPTAPDPQETPSHDAEEPVADAAEVVSVIDFRVWATNKQLSALKAFLKQNGIKYGKVPN